LNGKEGNENECKKKAYFKLPNHKLNKIKWGYLNKELIATTSSG